MSDFGNITIHGGSNYLGDNGIQLVGVSEEELLAALGGLKSDPKALAIVADEKQPTSLRARALASAGRITEGAAGAILASLSVPQIGDLVSRIQILAR